MRRKWLISAVERVAGIEPASQAWKAREVTVFCGKWRAILRLISRTGQDSFVNKRHLYRSFTAHFLTRLNGSEAA